MQSWGEQPADEGGFTLVELLVAIVVVAILTATAIIGIAGLQDKGANAACLSTKDAANSASLAYYANSSGAYPQTFADLTNPPTGQPMMRVPPGITQGPTTLTGVKGEWTLTMTPGATPSQRTTFSGC